MILTNIDAMRFTLPSFLFCLLIPFTVFAQEPELWGMTSEGANDFGTIFKTDGNGENMEVVHTFAANPARWPEEELYEASNGLFYGVTWNAGQYGNGVLYSFDPQLASMEKVLDFKEQETGSTPRTVIEANNGKLYGMTGSGGAYGKGTLYSVDLATHAFEKILDLNDTVTGSNPRQMVSSAGGKLYGSMIKGGILGVYGVLFEFDPIGNLYSILHEFTDSINGYGPGEVMLASNGLIYGTTLAGGAYNQGVLYSFDPAGNVYKKLWDFDGINGKSPLWSMVEAANGKLYGVSIRGGVNNTGVLFEFDPAADTLIKRMDFGVNPDGNSPVMLTLANNGKLYGVSQISGMFDVGVLFEFDPVTGNYAVKKHFSYFSPQKEDGYEPRSIVHGSDGYLYGLASSGGATNNGSLFRYDYTTDAYTKLLDFWDYREGGQPVGELVKAGDGLLYGVVRGGGSFSIGGLFSIDPVSGDYQLRYEFGEEEGPKGPTAGLIKGKDGKLYGLTAGGGSYELGSLYAYDPQKDEVEKLFDFNDTLGKTPWGAPIQASNGKLYGITTGGGSTYEGVIFEYDPVADLYEVLKQFDKDIEGCCSEGGLLEVEEGVLYGMTAYGGAYDEGTLFKFNINSGHFVKLVDFESSTKGASPYGEMIMASDGKLYGLTAGGGTYDLGVLYKYDQVTGVFEKKHDFAPADGGLPLGHLVRASNGKLYGLAAFNGANNSGTLFEYDPETDEFTKKQDLGGKYGSLPRGSLIELYGKFVGTAEQAEQDELFVYPNPAHKTLWLETPAFTSSIDIKLLDAAGRLVHRQVLQANGRQSIDISALSPGVYVLKVSKREEVITKKVVVE